MISQDLQVLVIEAPIDGMIMLEPPERRPRPPGQLQVIRPRPPPLGADDGGLLIVKDRRSAAVTKLAPEIAYDHTILCHREDDVLSTSGGEVLYAMSCCIVSHDNHMTWRGFKYILHAMPVRCSGGTRTLDEVVYHDDSLQMSCNVM